jgi:DNA invertase Pin-like site-specific DNA recombinase
MLPVHRGKFVAYYRVSTDKQGRSGLGLEAQGQAVRDRLDGGSWQLVGEYTEVESGRHKARPELAKALAACKKHKAKLVVAKLDRLSRNAGFLLTLLDSGVEVQVAELEAGLISERTKAALAAAKTRGVRLGPHGAVLASRYRAEADERARALAPTLRELQERGMSLRDMARELTKRKRPTPRGGSWHPQLVKRIIQRFDAADV